MRCIALFLCLSVALPAHAGVQQEWTGRTLRDLFAAKERIEQSQQETGDVAKLGILIGYSAAWSEALAVNGLVCFPESARMDDAIAALSRYVGDHPDQWTEPALVIVGRAWTEAYPCKRK